MHGVNKHSFDLGFKWNVRRLKSHLELSASSHATALPLMSLIMKYISAESEAQTDVGSAER